MTQNTKTAYRVLPPRILALKWGDGAYEIRMFNKPPRMFWWGSYSWWAEDWWLSFPLQLWLLYFLRPFFICCSFSFLSRKTQLWLGLVSFRGQLVEPKLNVSLSSIAAYVIFSKCRTAHVDTLLNPPLLSFALGIRVNSFKGTAQFGSSTPLHFHPDLHPSHAGYFFFPHPLHDFSSRRAFALVVPGAYAILPSPSGWCLHGLHISLQVMFSHGSSFWPQQL